MSLYCLGGLIFVRIFASRFDGAYVRKGLFFERGGEGGRGGLLPESHGILQNEIFLNP